jgi:spermidine/putrescine-binding protein
MVGRELDDYIKTKVQENLSKSKFPDYDDIYTDTFSELIDKLIIVHIRYWYLEDMMAKEKDDMKLSELRRKSESLFKEKRPMLVHAIDKFIIKLVQNKIDYYPSNLKLYDGWENKEA